MSNIIWLFIVGSIIYQVISSIAENAAKKKQEQQLREARERAEAARRGRAAPGPAASSTGAAPGGPADSAEDGRFTIEDMSRGPRAAARADGERPGAETVADRRAQELAERRRRQLEELRRRAAAARTGASPAGHGTSVPSRPGPPAPMPSAPSRPSATAATSADSRRRDEAQRRRNEDQRRKSAPRRRDEPRRRRETPTAPVRPIEQSPRQAARAARSEVGPPPAGGGDTPSTAEIRAMLRDPAALRRAIVLKELLDPPVSLR